MRILFIGPLPEPLTGHALACQVLLDALKVRHTVQVIDLSKAGFRNGVDSIGRIGSVLGIIGRAWRQQPDADVIYLTVSESIAGNLKDLLIYLACSRDLSRVVIHLHGGSLKKDVLDRSALLRRLNAQFIRRLGGVVILGPSHKHIFSGLIADERIHVVPNFAEEYLFATDEGIRAKFADSDRLRVVFLSNLITGKGFLTLVEAYRSMPAMIRDRVTMDFAGAFESDDVRSGFLGRIADLPMVHYHGVVSGDRKKALLSRAHVFCLPTALSEGQPISILEAYASGCFVITTGRGGIIDVFQDGMNGIEVAAESSGSLARALVRCLEEPARLLETGLGNAEMARRYYRLADHQATLVSIVESVGSTAAGSAANA